MIWLDGSRYDGYWKDDLPEGIVRLVQGNEDTYKGESKKGKAESKSIDRT